jgi:hypothetical protein
MNFKTLLITTSCLALTLLCGCATLDKLNQKRFTVEHSSLDWVQFSRTVNGKDDKNPVTVRLQLDGSGYLELRTGRSTRVKDDFWQQSATDNWQDIRTDRVVLSQDETVKIYQRLVDAGVYDRTKQRKEERAKATLAILARIDFEKKLVVTNDPVFIKIFDDLLAKF